MPTVNLNRPAIGSGQINAEDLNAARQHSTGRIVYLRRAVVLPAGCDGQGKHQTRQWAPFPDTVPTDYGAPGWLDSCAPEGGIARDPVESMARYRQTASTVRWGVALALVLAVVGYGFRVFLPLV